MARPRGSLNKRTLAAIDAAASGKLGRSADKTLAYLTKIVENKKLDDSVRMRAADVLLPYVKPRLASIEQTTIDPRDTLDPAEIEAKLKALYDGNPELFSFVRPTKSAGLEQSENAPAMTPGAADSVH